MIRVHQNLSLLELDDLRELQQAFTRPSDVISISMALEIASQVDAWEAANHYLDMLCPYDRDKHRSTEQ